MFKYILYNIISILILYELDSLFHNLHYNLTETSAFNRLSLNRLQIYLVLLLRSREINATLEYAASVAMGRDKDAVLGYCIVDELVVLGIELLQASLDDMITVEVLDELDDASFEMIDHSLDLCFGRIVIRPKTLDKLLCRAGPVDVEGDGDKVGSDPADNRSTLFGVAVVQQLLTQVVSEGVGHEVNNPLDHLTEDNIQAHLRVLFQLLLEEPATKLIPR